MKGLFEMTSYNRLFAYVYRKIRYKHPKWTHGQISHCTAYALRYHKKEKKNDKTKP